MRQKSKILNKMEKNGKMKMRRGYIFCIFIIILLIIGLVYLLIYPPSAEESPFGRIVKNAHIFVSSLAALLACVIALSTADPEKPKIKATISPFIAPKSSGKESLTKDDMPNELKQFYQDEDYPVVSYRVQFKITNTSNFDWVKPIVTFWLPVENQAADKEKKMRRYHSNTFNTQVDMKMIEAVDGIIISNSNLPHWPKGKHLTIWIRMVLDKDKSFDVEVSVNCENADGVTKKIQIKPQELLKQK